MVIQTHFKKKKKGAVDISRFPVQVTLNNRLTPLRPRAAYFFFKRLSVTAAAAETGDEAVTAACCLATCHLS